MKGKRIEAKICKTKEKGVYAKISVIERMDGTYTLNGQLIDENHIRLDQDIQATKKANSKEEIPGAREALISKMMKKLSKAVSDTTPSFPVEKKELSFSSFYRTLPDDEKKELILDTWKAPSTIHQGISYFEGFLAILDNYSEYDTLSDPIITKQIENDLKKKTTDHKRFKSYDGSAERRFSLHLNHINEQYRILQTLAKKHGLTFPELSFDVIIEKGITVENEQIKALSDKIYVQFSHELSIVHKTNGLASGAVIMGCSMTRTAEACAPIWRDIIFYDDFAVYAVIKQVDGKVVTCSLKTESAYRMIIIPKFARDLLFSRKEWLMAQIDDAGNRLYPNDVLDYMPVVSKADDPSTMAESDELSAFVKALLSKLGCGREFWAAVDIMIEKEPDRDSDGEKLTDPSAYVLRRNACSWLCNSAGMNPYLVDALMGHRLPHSEADRANQIRRKDEWPKIAAQMERIVLDPIHSANPGVRPLSLNKGIQQKLESYNRIILEAEDDVELCVHVRAREYDDPIHMRLPVKCKKIDLPMVAPDCSFPDHCIGKWISVEQYELWMKDHSGP